MSRIPARTSAWRLRLLAVAGSMVLAACAAGASPGSTASPRPAAARSGVPSVAASVPTAPASTAPACPRAVGHLRARVVQLAAPSGGCVPADVLMRYQCRHGPDPVVVGTLGAGGHPMTFLGGRFSSSVPGLPAGAEEVGVGNVKREMFVAPGSPLGLFVRSGGRVRRFLSLGPTVAGAHHPSALVLGDSIILGARSDVEHGLQGWRVTYDAEVSRSTSVGAEVARAEGPGHDAVVVELGANDGSPTAFAERARELMDSLRHVPLVVWVTIRETRDPFPATNHQIRLLATRYPNLVVADWNAVAPPAGMYSDGLHLNPIGAAAMAHLVDSRLNGWLAASRGAGDLACRAAAGAALT